MLLFKLKLCLLESSFAVHNMQHLKKKKKVFKLMPVIFVTDHRRMKDIRHYLTRLRLNPDKIDKPKREVSQQLSSIVLNNII